MTKLICKGDNPQYTVECNHCKTKLSKDNKPLRFQSIFEPNGELEAQGWLTKEEGGIYYDYCPECIKNKTNV